MSIIDHQQGTVRPTHPRQLFQWGNIPIHAEHAVGHHQLVTGSLGEHRFKRRDIAVSVAPDLGPAEDAAIDNRSMIEPVGKNGITAPGQR